MQIQIIDGSDGSTAEENLQWWPAQMHIGNYGPELEQDFEMFIIWLFMDILCLNGRTLK